MSMAVAIAILVLAVSRVRGGYRAVWMSWLNLLLGIWLIVSPFAIAGTRGAVTAHLMLVGVAVVLLALWSATASGQPVRPRRRVKSR
jgi:hypothetical protein